MNTEWERLFYADFCALKIYIFDLGKNFSYSGLSLVTQTYLLVEDSNKSGR